MAGEFTADIQRMRREAREHIDQGPITETYGADRVAQCITQLRGEPNFDPDGLAQRSHAEYAEGDTLLEMVREDLIAERIAIASYQEIVRWLGDDDPTSRDLIGDILAVEEEHADDMLSILQELG